AQGGYGDFDHLWTQTLDWLRYSLPITGGLLALTAIALREPRLTRPTPFAFAAAANACVFFAWLGWHPGAHMTYLFHLVTPVLIPAMWPALARREWTRTFVAACLPVAFVLNAGYFPLAPARFARAEATFAKIDAT